MVKKRESRTASRLGKGRLGSVGKKNDAGLDPETKKIYMDFLNSSPKVVVTGSDAAFLRSFLTWLKERGYIISIAKSKS